MQYFLASGGGLLSFETGFGIWVAISTLLLLYLMNKFLVPPIMEALNKRESQIKDSLESAEKALGKAEQISKDNAKALKEAEIQAQKIRREELKDVELHRFGYRERAKAVDDKIVDPARVTVERVMERVFPQVRDEVAQLAEEAPGDVRQAAVDKDKSSNLVDPFIGNLSKN